MNRNIETLGKAQEMPRAALQQSWIQTTVQQREATALSSGQGRLDNMPQVRHYCRCVGCNELRPGRAKTGESERARPEIKTKTHVASLG